MKNGTWTWAWVLVCVLTNSNGAWTQEAEQAPEPGAPTELIPLAVGNEWVYEKTGDGGSPVYTERVIGSILRNGQSWFLVRGGEDPGQRDSDEDWEYWTGNTAEGNADVEYSIANETMQGVFSEPFVYFRYPVGAGETYQLDDDLTEIQVVAVDARVTVPAGEFECILYQERLADTPDDEYMGSWWVCPGVGVVRSEWIHEGEVTVDVLRSYELVGEAD